MVTDQEIEQKCRQICKNSGEDPDQMIEMTVYYKAKWYQSGSTITKVPAWNQFKREAFIYLLCSKELENE